MILRFMLYLPQKSHRNRAVTLVEMMITMSLFGMAVAGLLAVQMFGMRQDQLVESKLGASDQSRRLLEKMGWEIRSAKEIYLGTVSGTSFTNIADGSLQRAAALQLKMPSSNYVTYFFVTNARTLSRIQTGVTGSVVVARDLTNNMFFQLEDYRGSVATTNDHKWRNCVRVMLEFAQYQYPLTQVGPGMLYDYYKMEYKVSPHSPAP